MAGTKGMKIHRSHSGMSDAQRSTMQAIFGPKAGGDVGQTDADKKRQQARERMRRYRARKRG